MPLNSLINALKKQSSANVAITAVALVGAAVGISASSVSRATFQRTRLTQDSFRWPTPAGVTVSREKTMTSKNTSAQVHDSNTAGTHRERTSFRWGNSAGASVSRKMTAASVQYVPPMLKTYKHSIEFDGY
jgi:hypothetical protein